MKTIAVALLLAGCSRGVPAQPDSPGARLEEAAVTRGLVADPAQSSPVGVWANDSDHLCVVATPSAFRIGATIDYGEGQGCTAVGDAVRNGDELSVRFGACRFDARYDGDHIAFPAELPAACSQLCAGRASLSALDVPRLSRSGSEAATLRASDGRRLCGG